MAQSLTELPADPAAVARIRRVTVSGAIDEAVRIVHDDPRSLFVTAVLMTTVPVTLALYFGMPPFEDLLGAVFSLLDGERPNFEPLLRRVAFVSLPPWFIAYRIAEPLALGALVAISAGVLTGQRLTGREAVLGSLRHAVTLVTMWFVRWLCVQIGTQFCYGPGILAAGFFFSAMPALVVERLGPMRALGRSIELTKKRFGESILLVLLLGLIEFVIGQIAQVMPRGLPQSVAVGLAHSGYLVLYAAASTVFYFSGRCQLEDLDLKMWVQTVVRRDELNPPEEATSLFGRPANV